MKSIGKYAFSCCYELTDAVIKAPIKVLPTNTFESCGNLTNLELPNTIEVIGQYAIYGWNIKSFHLPTSLKELQWNSFTGFCNLEEIILPEENKNFNLIDGVLYSKDMTWLYLYPSGDKTRERFVIPEGVTNTFWSSISGENLREVVIPNSMTELTRDFIYAPNLETLVLHDGIITVPEGCFTLPKYLTLGKNLWKLYPQYNCGGIYSVYCNNIQTLTDLCLTDDNGIVDRINYYSGHLTPNIILDSEYDIESHIYIPGKANWDGSNFEQENIHYMWDYHFNQTLQAFSLTSILPDVKILGVKVNGEYIDEVNGIYNYSSSEIPDVTIEYRLHGRQMMTTEYPSEFNASLPDEDLTTTSGIDSLFADGAKMDVYNTNGVLLRRGCGKAELKSLAPGVYIVRNNREAKTIVLY